MCDSPAQDVPATPVLENRHKLHFSTNNNTIAINRYTANSQSTIPAEVPSMSPLSWHTQESPRDFRLSIGNFSVPSSPAVENDSVRITFPIVPATPRQLHNPQNITGNISIRRGTGSSGINRNINSSELLQFVLASPLKSPDLSKDDQVVPYSPISINARSRVQRTENLRNLLLNKSPETCPKELQLFHGDDIFE